MFDKGKRARRQNEDDKVFNRMLLWLAGVVVLELLLLLLQKAYVDMAFGAVAAKGLLDFFKIFNIAGVVILAGCAVWAALFARSGKPVALPAALAAAGGVLWVVSLVCRFIYPDGVRILMLFPAGGAVLIIILFLYQRPFFYNAALTCGGLLAVWLHRQYYMNHPRLITACIVGGLVVLALAAALAFLLRRNDGTLGRVRVLPPESNYFMTWLTCAVTGVVMVLALVLGVSAGQYLLYVLAGWLFAQAVYFPYILLSRAPPPQKTLKPRRYPRRRRFPMEKSTGPDETASGPLFLLQRTRAPRSQRLPQESMSSLPRYTQMISQLLEQPPQPASRVRKSMSSTAKSNSRRPLPRRARIATPRAPIRCPLGSTITGQFRVHSKAATTPLFLLTPPWNTTGETIFLPFPTLLR